MDKNPDLFNLNFKKLLKELKSKAKDKNIFFLNPLEDKSKDILKKITKGGKIKNPADKVVNFLTEKAESAVMRQSLIIYERINKALKF